MNPTTTTTAGRDVDARVAVEVMKWRRITYREAHEGIVPDGAEWADKPSPFWRDAEGNEVAPWNDKEPQENGINWSPSTDISAVMEVVDKLNASSIQFVRTRNDDWACFITLPVTGASERFYAEAATRPMALCLAALKAVGGRGNNL